MSGLYTKKLKSITYRLLPILLSVLLLSGCKAHSPLIVTVNDKKLYLKDFYYDIYLIEKEGNQLEDYYLEKLGYSYWDYEYKGTTMREAAKSSVITFVVMYEILSDQARLNGMTLTEDELSSNEETARKLLKEIPDDDKKAYGITYKVLKGSIDRDTLGEKYRSKLVEKLPVDIETVKSSINKEDYSSLDRYNQAVEDAIKEAEDTLFAEAYNEIKDNYDITINFENWDAVIIGKASPKS